MRAAGKGAVLPHRPQLTVKSLIFKLQVEGSHTMPSSRIVRMPLFPEIFSREILRESFARLKKPLSLQRNQGNEETFKQEIAESYDLVTDSPTKRIYEAVKRIPKGKVATYGKVAEMAGNKKMSRAVGNALHKNPDPENIPCFRVVNSKGELAPEFAFGGMGEQKKLLEAEGIEVKNNKVDLSKYGLE